MLTEKAICNTIEIPKQRATKLMNLFDLAQPDIISIAIPEVTNDDHNKINKPPDSAAAKSDEHQDSCTCMTCVKPVYSKYSKEPAKKEGYEPLITGTVPVTKI